MRRFLAAAIISLTILGHYSSVDAGPCFSKMPRQYPNPSGGRQFPDPSGGDNSAFYRSRSTQLSHVSKSENVRASVSPLLAPTVGHQDFSRFSNVVLVLQRAADMFEHTNNQNGVPLTDASNPGIACALEVELSMRYGDDQIFNVLVWDPEEGQSGLDIIDDLAACNVPEPADECLDSDGFLQNELQFAGSTRHYVIFWLWNNNSIIFQLQAGYLAAVRSCSTGSWDAISLHDSRGFAQGVAECVMNAMSGTDKPRVVLVVPHNIGHRLQGHIFITDTYGHWQVRASHVTVVILPA